MSPYKQKLQVSIKLMFDYFWAQIYIIAFNIGLNIFSKTWSIVFPTKKVLGFIDTKMSCQKLIVILTDKLYSDSFWYK